MEKAHNFTTTDIFAEHLTLTFSLDNDISLIRLADRHSHFGAATLAAPEGQEVRLTPIRGNDRALDL